MSRAQKDECEESLYPSSCKHRDHIIIDIGLKFGRPNFGVSPIFGTGILCKKFLFFD